MLESFPTIDEILKMEPEELAPFLLKYLKKQPVGSINRYNFTLLSDQSIYKELNDDRNKHKSLAQKFMEAWMWLEHAGLVLPNPGQQSDWSFITPKGHKLSDDINFESYKEGKLFPSDLDPILVSEVRPLFVRGDYDTAVFRSFKEVEVRVRGKAKLSNDDFGVDLMRKAFGNGGPLENLNVPKGERDATRELFSGSLGTFKNPSSHREVKYTDPKEVIDVIRIANQLLRMVDRI